MLGVETDPLAIKLSVVLVMALEAGEAIVEEDVVTDMGFITSGS